MRALYKSIENLEPLQAFGRVESAHGLQVEVTDAQGRLAVGGRVRLGGDQEHGSVDCEVVGFKDGRAICLPYDTLHGVRMGGPAAFLNADANVFPSHAWLGRVVNALGEPIDGKGPLPRGTDPCNLRASPPPAHKRVRLGDRIDLGVRALNCFATCMQGQRMGVFAGSGVGKSVLMSMMARYTSSDIAVIGLIGERGREVKEFIEDDLGPEGLARSVVVVATSDESALKRRQAAYMTLTLAEYFRDQGAQVLCLIDSITRFAMAQREIGLAAGEPPTTKGYTPSVFAELPRLLERAGPGAPIANGGLAGAITGLFTVLVDGGDHDEPIADAVRGILDGHIVMERKIAERGRFPAINVLKSVSRTMPNNQSDDEQASVRRARNLLSTYEDMAELIRIGAYQKGADPDVDAAIHYQPKLEAFLAQHKDDQSNFAHGFAALEQILRAPNEGAVS